MYADLHCGKRKSYGRERNPQHLAILQEANFTLKRFLKNMLCVILSQDKETNLIQNDLSPLGSRCVWTGQGSVVRTWAHRVCTAPSAGQSPLQHGLRHAAALDPGSRLSREPQGPPPPPRDLPRAGSSSSSNQTFTRIRKAAFSIETPPLGPLRVCRSIFLPVFHIQSSEHSQRTVFSSLVTWGGSLA